jgi:hypothetical protein
LFIVGFVVFSCGKEKPIRNIQLPSTSVLSINSTWAVVSSNYLRMRKNPSRTAEVLDGLTKGTVVEIIVSTEREETVENETARWYRVDLEGLKGWVFGAYLDIFDTRAKAVAHAEAMQ